MAVAAADVQFVKSANTGSGGGAISGTVETSGVDNNFWSDVNPAQSAAGGSQVKKFFVRNNHGSDTLAAFVLYEDVMPTNTVVVMGVGIDSADDDTYEVGIDLAWAGGPVAMVSDGSDTRVMRIVGTVAGVPTEEDVTLDGTNWVVSVATFDDVYAIYADSESALRTIEIRDTNSAGAVWSSIQINRVIAFRWVALVAGDDATGIKRIALAAGDAHGFWTQMSWAAGAGAVAANTETLAIELV